MDLPAQESQVSTLFKGLHERLVWVLVESEIFSCVGFSLKFVTIQKLLIISLE